MSNQAVTKVTIKWLHKNKAIADFLTTEAKRYAKEDRWEDYIEALAEQVADSLEDLSDASLAHAIAAEATELVDWEAVAESFWP